MTMFQYSIFDKDNQLVSQWDNLINYLYALNPDWIDLEIDVHYSKINLELKQYNASYNWADYSISFETEKDYMFFKLRFS